MRVLYMFALKNKLNTRNMPLNIFEKHLSILNPKLHVACFFKYLQQSAADVSAWGGHPKPEDLEHFWKLFDLVFDCVNAAYALANKNKLQDGENVRELFELES